LLKIYEISEPDRKLHDIGNLRFPRSQNTLQFHAGEAGGFALYRFFPGQLNDFIAFKDSLPFKASG
jgi:hypothetical protein